MGDDFDKYRAEVLKRWDKADFEGKLAMTDEAIKARILGDPDSLGEQMAEIRQRSEMDAPREGDAERWKQLSAISESIEREAALKRSNADGHAKSDKARSSWDYDR